MSKTPARPPPKTAQKLRPRTLAVQPKTASPTPMSRVRPAGVAARPAAARQPPLSRGARNEYSSKFVDALLRAYPMVSVAELIADVPPDVQAHEFTTATKLLEDNRLKDNLRELLNAFWRPKSRGAS